MPTRTAFSPRTVPRRFTRFSSFPESKVHGIFFAVVHFDTSSGHHIVQGTMAQFPVVFKTLNTIIYIAVQLVGMAVFNQFGNHGYNIIHMFRYARIFIGTLNVELIHDFKVRSDISIGNCIPRYFFPVGGIDNLIIHIRKILNMRNGIA